MRKTLRIGSNDVTFESNAVTPYFYKQQFKRDYFSDLMKMAKSMQGAQNLKGQTDLSAISWDDLEHLDFEVLTNFAWACAKTANKETKPLLEWLEDNPEFDPLDHGIEIADLITSNISPKKKQTVNSRARKN